MGDGCSAYSGTPLQHHLYMAYGAPVIFGYFLVYLFMTIGIFNLIMAIFIERVLASAAQRKQEELGSRNEICRIRIKEVIGLRFLEDDTLAYSEETGEKMAN